MNSSGAPFSICFQAILDSLFGEYLTKYYLNFCYFFNHIFGNLQTVNIQWGSLCQWIIARSKYHLKFLQIVNILYLVLRREKVCFNEHHFPRHPIHVKLMPGELGTSEPCSGKICKIFRNKLFLKYLRSILMVGPRAFTRTDLTLVTVT